MKNEIIIRGAREHNLKNISLHLPREQLIVLTGPSGSGKSSLAFDTIYAEGHRRYVESLSTYARQFLERIDKPDVDFIDGINPSISIEQHNPVTHSRSTVGTSSEIYDYLRLLFSKAGDLRCPSCKKIVSQDTEDRVVDNLLLEYVNSRGFILFEKTVNSPENIKEYLSSLLSKGFLRILLEEEVIDLDSLGLHDASFVIENFFPKDLNKFYIVVDRLEFSEVNRSRITESVETAFLEGNTYAQIKIVDGPFLRFSKKLECCGISFQLPLPSFFSFNNPNGACSECGGFGNTLALDESLLVPDSNLTLAQGAVQPWKMPRYRERFGRQLLDSAKNEGLDIHKPWKELTKKHKKMIFNGSKSLLGIYPFFERLKKRKYKVWVRVLIRRYQSLYECVSCSGSRLREEAHYFEVNKKKIGEICDMSIAELKSFFDRLSKTKNNTILTSDLFRQIRDRIQFLHNMGLEYLTLSRETKTLSGGEHQRINLAKQLGARLTGTLYVLDEPTIGLHPRDNLRLINILKGLVDQGNTVLVVEHDRDVIEQSDYIIDLGPGAGEKGGQIVFDGLKKDFNKSRKSKTALYLSREKNISVHRNSTRLKTNKKLSLYGAQENNLKRVDLHIPLSKLVAVTGVSGSGKSSLIHGVLYPALARILKGSNHHVGRFKRIEGYENVTDVVLLDQSPIGKSPRSNPVTYLKAYDIIRKLFSETKKARSLGFTPGHFSFNSSGGRCMSCSGSGVQKIEMHFMADLFATCPDCKGKRFSAHTLEIKYKDLDVNQVLQLTVDEAIVFFHNVGSIVKKLNILRDVGLGYLRIGQPVNTLSGGEAQRLKIAGQLSSKPPHDVLYLMDEPTTGLHFQDVECLMKVLYRLVSLGNTVVVIEHNLDIISGSDWVIDLGPEGGENGGCIIAQGTPEEIQQNKLSKTGSFLKNYLKNVS
ncbi:MAG: excinuclease ABC subunit UvrA [Nitrospinota bacterium]|nr:excinuclease ABC subunit UvrA [Nitrospinota bacterium]